MLPTPSFAKAVVLAAGLGLVTASCASVSPSQVRTVRDRKDVPLGLCGYIGRVAADTANDASQAELELREQAARRGANTVLLIAGQGAMRGKAYVCHTLRSGAGGPLAYGLIYSQNVPVVEYTPPGAPKPAAQSRN